MQLSIVVPCYNESENLPYIFGRFRELLRGRADIEVVLVNNGSTDSSAKVFAAEVAQPENAFARLVTVPVNRGYGHGILSGLRQARGEFVAWTHADLQTDPRDVLSAYEQIVRRPLPQRCFVRGRRVGRGWLDVFFTLGMSLVASLALRTRLTDINAQPKLFHRSLLYAMHDAPWDFSLDLYVLYLARQQDLEILEQPVHFGRRLYGQAKGGGTLRGKMRLILRTWRYIIELRRSLRTGVMLAPRRAGSLKKAA